MALRLQCPCGEVLVEETEDEMVATARAHLAQEHPKLAEEYTPDQILFMATEWPSEA
jgi:hypothetical protein